MFYTNVYYDCELINLRAFLIGWSIVEYVDSWLRLGHSLLFSNTIGDELDIMNTRNSLCTQINNVLCYVRFISNNVKIKLLMSYCSSHYGAELWVLCNRSIIDVCVRSYVA